MAEEKNLNPAPDNPSGQPVDAGMQSLVRMLQILFWGLRILIILVFAYLLFSGMFRVDEGKVAMLFRFGALQSRQIDPDTGPTSILVSGHWYWAWPYPIDRVKEMAADTSISVNTGNHFRPWVKAVPGQEEQELEVLRPGVDGYTITGDTNIMHAQWEVTYRVADASAYYLKFYDDHERSAGSKNTHKRGAEQIINCLLSEAVILEFATWKGEELWSTTRVLPDGTVENIKDRVQERLTQLLKEVGLGVQVQSVNIIAISPPDATRASFESVNASQEDGQKEILNAKTYRDKVILQAEGRKYQIINEAKSYQTRVVETVKADSSYFETVLAEYNRNPDTMLTALYTDALREVLGKVPNKYIVHRLPDGKQELRLQLSPVPEKDNRPQEPKP
ncbi:MAG: protease modulator HflK [Lentisphaerae bacterium]|jgi:membrane protease subunit HflK|nr:protease modulator HflK [Lentisphaerota bacterium]